jgi:hypothetical protein
MSEGIGGRAPARARRGLAGIGLAVLALACLALVSASAASASSVWLCKPGLAKDPCTKSLNTEVVQTDGETSVEKVRKAQHPSIDCFYVYPTVSEQKTTNANLEIEPQETAIAVEQASRFSQDCRVFAPMYPQLTLKAISGPVPPEAAEIAYAGVLEAWREYLADYNDGRGVVLIGHSQGALMLKQLIEEQIDPSPALRHQLVSAVLLGGNVLVPEGQLVGGDFQNVPACQSASETHCVIAYSSFLKEPPEGSFFGRPNSPLLEGGGSTVGMQVLCVNPTQFTQDEGAAGPLLPYALKRPFPGELGAGTVTPTGTKPWVEAPGEYTAQCHHENGASWLQINPVGAAVDPDEYVKEALGPDWGLHLYDVNIALGNLVDTVAVQAAAYQFEG